MIVRDETEEDAAQIGRLVGEALGPAEAALVAELRVRGAAYSLVAELGGEVASYALFSAMRAPERMLGLAPVATAATHRRRGLAAALTREGIRRATAEGWRGIFVLGEVAYYGRFGFDPAAAAGVTSPYAGPHLMFLPLDGDALLTPGTEVSYAAAFDALG